MRTIHSKQAPPPIGPYSQAVAAGGFLFLSGQIALDPASGTVVGTTAAEQAEQVVKNIHAVLQAAGTSAAQIAKTTIYLRDMADFPSVNEVYGRWLKEHGQGHLPARSTIAVAGLPKDVRVEIEVTVWSPTP